MDSMCHQALRHLGTESAHYPNPARAGAWQDIRLSGFIDLLNENSYDFSFIDIRRDQLDDADVLVIAGRSNLLSYSQDELDNVRTYYEQHGSIFLMSNHMGFVAPQNQISSELNLPITFNETTVYEENQKLILNTSHPISSNCYGGLHIRTSCKMSIAHDLNIQILVRNEDQSIGVFATAYQDQLIPSKRVISITSAGHISSHDDCGRNLLSEATNGIWTLNALNWLTGGL